MQPLPSVGAGDSPGGFDCLRPVPPTVQLKESSRQSQESLIVMSAHRIVEGKLPDLRRHDSDFFFLPRKGAPQKAAPADCLPVQCAPAPRGSRLFQRHGRPGAVPRPQGGAGHRGAEQAPTGGHQPPRPGQGGGQSKRRPVPASGDKVMQDAQRLRPPLGPRRTAPQGRACSTGTWASSRRLTSPAVPSTSASTTRTWSTISSTPPDELEDPPTPSPSTRARATSCPAVVIPVLDPPRRLWLPQPAVHWRHPGQAAADVWWAAGRHRRHGGEQPKNQALYRPKVVFAKRRVKTKRKDMRNKL